jgi:arylsulfatase
MEAVVPGAARRRHPAIWAESFAVLRVPKLFNLRTDPYERADTTSNTYWDWVMDHTFLAVPTQATFQELPPRQKAASFTVDPGMGKLLAGIARRQP